MSAPSAELELALTAARRGAAVLRDFFGASLQVEEKSGNRGLVTTADQAAEQAILGCLQAGSSYAILSEEAGFQGRASGPQWVVDPLDGTTNFARGIPLFGVCVALAEGPDLRLGVILNPLSRDEYSAEQGAGACLNGAPLRLPPEPLKRPPVFFVNHGYAEADRLRFAEVTRRLAPHAFLRKFGTTALELCTVVAGLADAWLCSGDELWDYAAGLVLAREVGCQVSDWRGRPWDGSNSFLLVSSPHWQARLVERVRDLQD